MLSFPDYCGRCFSARCARLAAFSAEARTRWSPQRSPLGLRTSHRLLFTGHGETVSGAHGSAYDWHGLMFLADSIGLEGERGSFCRCREESSNSPEWFPPGGGIVSVGVGRSPGHGAGRRGRAGVAAAVNSLPESGRPRLCRGRAVAPPRAVPAGGGAGCDRRTRAMTGVDCAVRVCSRTGYRRA